MQVNAALSKRATPAPKKAPAKKTAVKKTTAKPAAKKADGPSLPSLPTNPFADDGKKPVAKKPVVKKKPVAKKAKKPTPVKKAVRKAIKSKVSPAEALAKWYGAYAFIRAMRPNLESSAYLEIRRGNDSFDGDSRRRAWTRARDGIDRAFERDRARSTGGGDRRPVEGRRRRTRAIERAIDRDPTVGRGEDMVCGWGVCVWMFDGGMWGVYMGRVDGWRMRKRRASLRLSSSRCVSSFEGVRRDD
tara:strand:- start:1284 stop:2018 length:735 start_codon:yes stop_codon:yes gene_type:complete